MQTLTIDLPDDVNIRNARTFVLEQLHEAGFLVSDQTAEVDDDSDSWFTPEMRKKAEENRRRLDEEAAKNPPKRSKEELLQLLVNLPMPDEETIKRQDEIAEMRKRWTSPW
jgi:hypothetical protein